MLGLSQLSSMYARVGTGGRQALSQAVFMEAQSVLNESKKIVPVDTGVLKNSGKVEKPTIREAGVSVEVTYGGAAAPYALIVHEDLNARHAPGKSAKYLEIPALQRKPLFTRNVKMRFAAYIQRGA